MLSTEEKQITKQLFSHAKTNIDNNIFSTISQEHLKVPI